MSNHNPKWKDLTGIRFGKLKVMKFLGVHPGNGGKACSWWECKCSCSNHTVISVVATDLLTGRKRDCGCVNMEQQHIRQINDLTGQDFGRYHVDAHTKRPVGLTHRGAYWKCHCRTCGYVNIIRGDKLVSGYTTLCPVCDKDIFNKHSKSDDATIDTKRLYRIWFAMNDRCNNPNNNAYKHYGKKGITVCWRWSSENPDGKDNFIKDAYSNGYYDQPKNTPYGSKLSIERKNIKLGYSPDNCIWIPTSMQPRNTSRNRYITDIDGTQMIYKEFEEKYNINVYQLKERKWSLNAIVYKAHHITQNIRKHGNSYIDNEGFTVLIPNYGNSE